MLNLPEKDVHYLAFQGGGGKAFAFLGAIKALEKKGILPVDRGQIKGISGSSAGALVAVLLSLGLRSGQIESLILKNSDRLYDWGKPFNSLRGYLRLYDEKKSLSKSTVFSIPIKQTSYSRLVEYEKKVERTLDVASILQVYQPIIYYTAVKPLKNKFKAYRPSTKLSKLIHELLRKQGMPQRQLSRFMRGFNTYFENILIGGGLLPGFGMRDWIRGLIVYRLMKKYGRTRYGPNLPLGTFVDIDFSKFKSYTGIDLRITGTNLITQKPAIFSESTSPYVGVADVVANSMSFPIIYKPGIIRNSKSPGVNGIWTDGGVLNNFPIHAFDEHPDFPINPNMLGFRLIGNTPQPVNFNEEREIERIISKLKTESIPIQDLLSGLAQSLLYPSNAGQIRTPLEDAKIVNLFTYNLKLLNFKPTPNDRLSAIRDAEIKTRDYFKQSTSLSKCQKALKEVQKSYSGTRRLETEFERMVRNRSALFFDHVSSGQVTLHPLKTKNGSQFESEWCRVDIVANKGGTFYLIEVKSSKSAPLTAAQKKIFDKVALKGGVLTSQKDPQIPRGTKILTQKVLVIRPEDFCKNYLSEHKRQNPALP